MKEKHPLEYPPGRKRTTCPVSSRFRTSYDHARRLLAQEFIKSGVSNPVLTTNVVDRRLAVSPNGEIDPGAAVYFTHGKKQMVLACDRYKLVADNIWAIVKTLDALRAIRRWGSSDMMERAYSGFAALPAPVIRPWWAVLEVSPTATRDAIEASYRRLARERHPDAGGSTEAMAELNAARRASLAALTKETI